MDWQLRSRSKYAPPIRLNDRPPPNPPHTMTTTIRLLPGLQDYCIQSPSWLDVFASSAPPRPRPPPAWLASARCDDPLGLRGANRPAQHRPAPPSAAQRRPAPPAYADGHLGLGSAGYWGSGVMSKKQRCIQCIPMIFFNVHSFFHLLSETKWIRLSGSGWGCCSRSLRVTSRMTTRLKKKKTPLRYQQAWIEKEQVGELLGCC